jgi:hypothetical protein
MLARNMLERKRAEKKKPVTVMKDMQEFLTTQLAQRHNGHRLSGIGTLELDSEAYRHTDWHFKIVCYLYGLHGWGVAGAYHHIIMERVNNKTLSAARYYDTPECLSGNIEECMVENAYFRALQSPSTGKTPGVPGAVPGSGAGTSTRVNASDTYCSKHGKYYKVAQKHSTANCKKSG